jgi:hypothetical protein
MAVKYFINNKNLSHNTINLTDLVLLAIGTIINVYTILITK